MAEAESRAQGEISRMRAQLEDVSYSHAETDAQLSTREVRIFAIERRLWVVALFWVGRKCMSCALFLEAGRLTFEVRFQLDQQQTSQVITTCLLSLTSALPVILPTGGGG